MTVVLFNTVESIRELKSAGFTDEQAEAQVKVFFNAIRQGVNNRLDELATKRDLKELELRITEVIAGVQREVAVIQADLQREVAGIRADVQGEVAGVRGDVQREVAGIRADVQREIADVHREIADVQREIAGVQANLQREIAESKTEIIKWVAGMLVVQSGILIGAIFAAVKFLL